MDEETLELQQIWFGELRGIELTKATKRYNDRREAHARKVAVQQAKFRGWRIYEAGGMLCDCATSDEAAGWQASRDADAAMRRCEVR